MSEENKALVRSFFEESNRRKAPADELLAPDFTVYLPGIPPMDASAFRK